MRAAIMQPYFLPYIGYFQLMASVEKFVVYDNIKYVKQSWINRNRILQNGGAAWVSLPLKSASDSLNIYERNLATEFDRKKLLRQFSEAYRRAPHFSAVYPLLERIIQNQERNLFRYLLDSLEAISSALSLQSQLIVSSSIEADHHLAGEARVISICKALGAKQYINPIGGLTLYDKHRFASAGIELAFLRSKLSPYAQSGSAFVPALSIIDLMMFNSSDRVREFLHSDFEIC
jgi:hypothetical protein